MTASRSELQRTLANPNCSSICVRPSLDPEERGRRHLRRHLATSLANRRLAPPRLAPVETRDEHLHELVLRKAALRRQVRGDVLLAIPGQLLHFLRVGHDLSPWSDQHVTAREVPDLDAGLTTALTGKSDEVSGNRTRYPRVQPRSVRFSRTVMVMAEALSSPGENALSRIDNGCCLTVGLGQCKIRNPQQMLVSLFLGNSPVSG